MSTRKRPVTAARKLAAAADNACPFEATGEFFKPELATLKDSPPAGDAWLHEVKWDGYRILAAIAGGEVRLWSRNALPWSEKIPAIHRAVASLGLESGELDGELIALVDGHPDFNALQRALSGDRTVPLVYMLFDVPAIEGHDLHASPLHQRKAVLEALLAQPPAHLAYSGHTVGEGDKLFAMAQEQRLEGIMCKRADSPYRGGRGDDWRKVKRLDADEFAVVGYTAPQHSRKGFGALLLARPAAKGWEYVGRVGTGFNHAQLLELTRTLAKGGSATPNVIDPKDAPRDARWIKPTAVAEVYYRGIGNSGLLRQPSLKTMRPDKVPADLLDSDRPRPTPDGARRHAP